MTIRITRTRAILAAVLLAVVVGATAYAAIPDSGGQIHGCYKTGTGNQGALRVIDTAKGQTCASGETALTWSQRGPTGSRGSTGAGGPTGSRGATGTRGATGPTGLKGATGVSGSLDGGPCTFDGAPGVIRQFVPPSQNDDQHAQGATQISFYCVSTDGLEPNDSQDTATPISNWLGSIGGQLAVAGCATIFPTADVDWYTSASTALTSATIGACVTPLMTTTLAFDVYRDGVLVAQGVTQYQAPDSTVHSWLFRVSASETTGYELLLRRPTP